MCKIIIKGQSREPFEIICSGLTEEQIKTCEEELNTLVNAICIINLSESDIKFMGKGRKVKALYDICGDNWSDIFDGMDKAFAECKERFKNLATIISFSGKFENEPIFELTENYFKHCIEDKILTDIPTEFGMRIKNYDNFLFKATLIIFAE